MSTDEGRAKLKSLLRECGMLTDDDDFTSEFREEMEKGPCFACSTIEAVKRRCGDDRKAAIAYGFVVHVMQTAARRRGDLDLADYVVAQAEEHLGHSLTRMPYAELGKRL